MVKYDSLSEPLALNCSYFKLVMMLSHLNVFFFFIYVV